MAQSKLHFKNEEQEGSKETQEQNEVPNQYGRHQTSMSNI